MQICAPFYYFDHFILSGQNQTEMANALSLKEQAGAWADETKQHCLKEGETKLATLLSELEGKTDDQNDVFQAAVQICKPFIDFDADILSTPTVRGVLKTRMNDLLERSSKLVASLASAVDYPWDSIMKQAAEHTEEYANPQRWQSNMCRFDFCALCCDYRTTFETAEAKKFMDCLADHEHVTDITDEWVGTMLTSVAHRVDYKYQTKSYSAKVRSLRWKDKSLKRKASDAASDSKRAG